MQVISFKQTTLFKTGLWLSTAALTAFALTPSALDGSLWRNPLPNLAPAVIIGLVCLYVLWKIHILGLADLVIDGEDHLLVRRKKTQEKIPFSNISATDVTTAVGIHRITVRLRAPALLGAQIEFLPQASLWSSVAGIRRVAAELTERANRAK